MSAEATFEHHASVDKGLKIKIKRKSSTKSSQLEKLREIESDQYENTTSECAPELERAVTSPQNENMEEGIAEGENHQTQQNSHTGISKSDVIEDKKKKNDRKKSGVSNGCEKSVRKGGKKSRRKSCNTASKMDNEAKQCENGSTTDSMDLINGEEEVSQSPMCGKEKSKGKNRKRAAQTSLVTQEEIPAKLQCLEEIENSEAVLSKVVVGTGRARSPSNDTCDYILNNDLICDSEVKDAVQDVKVKIHDEISTDQKDTTTGACSVGVMTDPDCLGPCEPGSSVVLEGIVWSESNNGILVVNVTWKGKTYVGSLMDATRHHWGSPSTNRRIDIRFYDEASELEWKASRGRWGSLTPTSEISEGGRPLRKCRKGTVSTQPPPNKSQWGIRSSPSQGESGGRRRGSVRGTSTAEINKTKSIKASSPPCVEETNSKAGSLSPPCLAPAAPVAPSADQLYECRAENCNKKFKQVSGLTYHQNHAHGKPKPTNNHLKVSTASKSQKKDDSGNQQDSNINSECVSGQKVNEASKTNEMCDASVREESVLGNGSSTSKASSVKSTGASSEASASGSPFKRDTQPNLLSQTNEHFLSPNRARVSNLLSSSADKWIPSANKENLKAEMKLESPYKNGVKHEANHTQSVEMAEYKPVKTELTDGKVPGGDLQNQKYESDYKSGTDYSIKPHNGISRTFSEHDLAKSLLHNKVDKSSEKSLTESVTTSNSTARSSSALKEVRNDSVKRDQDLQQIWAQNILAAGTGARNAMLAAFGGQNPLGYPSMDPAYHFHLMSSNSEYREQFSQWLMAEQERYKMASLGNASNSTPMDMSSKTLSGAVSVIKNGVASHSVQHSGTSASDADANRFNNENAAHKSRGGLIDKINSATLSQSERRSSPKGLDSGRYGSPGGSTLRSESQGAPSNSSDAISLMRNYHSKSSTSSPSDSNFVNRFQNIFSQSSSSSSPSASHTSSQTSNSRRSLATAPISPLAFNPQSFLPGVLHPQTIPSPVSGFPDPGFLALLGQRIPDSRSQDGRCLSADGNSRKLNQERPTSSSSAGKNSSPVPSSLANGKFHHENPAFHSSSQGSPSNGLTRKEIKATGYQNGVHNGRESLGNDLRNAAVGGRNKNVPSHCGSQSFQELIKNDPLNLPSFPAFLPK